MTAPEKVIAGPPAERVWEPMKYWNMPPLSEELGSSTCALIPSIRRVLPFGERDIRLPENVWDPGARVWEGEMNSEKELAVIIMLPNVAIATCQNEEVISVQLLLGVCKSSVWSEVRY